MEFHILIQTVAGSIF